MAAEVQPVIRVFPINSTGYTPIVAPIPCNYFLIQGTSDGSAMVRSSDGTDVNSYPFVAGGWYSFLAPPNPWSRKSTVRYQPGAVVTYLKAANGSPNVVMEFSE